MTAATSSATRSARLGLRATPEQEAALRRAAGVARSLLGHSISSKASIAGSHR